MATGSGHTRIQLTVIHCHRGLARHSPPQGLKFVLVGAGEWLRFDPPTDRIDVPALFFAGEEDELVKPEQSVVTAEYFEEPWVFRHDGDRFTCQTTFTCPRLWSNPFCHSPFASHPPLPPQLLTTVYKDWSRKWGAVRAMQELYPNGVKVYIAACRFQYVHIFYSRFHTLLR